MAEASFFPRAEPLSVADIAALARIDLPHGACGTATISGAAPLETAGPDDLVYMDNAKYAEVLGSTRMRILLNRTFSQPLRRRRLRPNRRRVLLRNRTTSVARIQ